MTDRATTLAATAFPEAPETPPAGLVICLHGWGANQYDLMALASALDLSDCQFFFPDAPFPHPQMPSGRQWYDLMAIATGEMGWESLVDATPAGLEDSRDRLRAWLLDLADGAGVPPAKTVLTGFSQGGAMALDVGRSLPLAGIVTYSGYLHQRLGPGDWADGPPLLVMHGRQDPVVPLPAARATRDALKLAGANLRYREFEPLGHAIAPEELQAARAFIRAAIAGEPLPGDREGTDGGS